MNRRLVRTAYHEAGHAAIAHFLNRDIDSITIVPQKADPDTVGRVSMTTGWLDELTLTEKIAHLVAVRLAGPVAEYIRRHFRGVISQENNDYDEALEIMSAGGMSHEESRAAIATLEPFVERELLYRWPSVCALAETLIEDRVVEGKRAHAILDKAEPMPRQLRLPFMD